MNANRGSQPLEVRVAEVVGTVEFLISGRDSPERDRPADACICCPGPHVFSRGIAVSDTDYDWGDTSEHLKGRAHDWLWRELTRLWQEHGYDLEGARVRLSLDLVPEPASSQASTDE